MKDVLVIQESSADESLVIGVADNKIDALIMINSYYGEYKLLVEYANSDECNNICFSKKLEVKDHNGEPYIVSVYAEWFSINVI